MPTIKITVTEKLASLEGSPVYVCGNSDYSVAFTFDAEWSAHNTKTARFCYRSGGLNRYIDKIFTGTTCPVPVLSDVDFFLVGVYAGDLRTTTPAKVRAQRGILCGSGMPADPPESVYNQLVTLINTRVPADAAWQNVTANALRGSAAGAVVGVSDVSPIPHELGVKVAGKNIFNPEMLAASYEVNGLTITRDGDKITVNGTATSSFSCPVIPMLLPITRGADYVCTVYAVSGSGDALVASFGEGKVAGVRLGFYDCTLTAGSASAFRTFTAAHEYITSFMLFFNAGATFENLAIKVQLEQSDASTAYEAYTDPTTVEVRRYGKNLAPAPAAGTKTESNGVTFEALTDGGINTTGTPTGISRLSLYAGAPIVSRGTVTLTLSGNYKNIVPDFQLLDAAGAILKHIQTGTGATIDLDSYPGAVRWELAIKRLQNNVAVSGVVYAQLEVGSRATDFEAYQAPTKHTPGADGTVEGVASLAPSVTLLTDTPGVSIALEYNRDINTAFNSLKALIAAGGGGSGGGSVLTDEVTGDLYSLAVSNGNLKMIKLEV